MNCKGSNVKSFKELEESIKGMTACSPAQSILTKNEQEIRLNDLRFLKEETDYLQKMKGQRQKMQGLKRAVEQANIQIEEKKNQIFNLSTQNQRLVCFKDKFQQLSLSNQRALFELSRVKEENGYLEQRLKGIQKQKLRQQIFQLQQVVLKKESQNQCLQNELLSKGCHADQFSKALDEAQSQLHNLKETSRLQQIRTKKQMDILKAKNGQFMAQTRKLQDAVINRQNQIQEQNKLIKSLKEQLKECQIGKQQQEKAALRIKEYVEKMKHQFQSKITNLNCRLLDQTNQNSALKKVIKEVQIDRQQIIKDKDEAQKLAHELKEHASHLSFQNQKIRQKVQADSQISDKQTQSIDDLKAKVETLEKHIECINSRKNKQLQLARQMQLMRHRLQQQCAMQAQFLDGLIQDYSSRRSKKSK